MGKRSKRVRQPGDEPMDEPMDQSQEQEPPQPQPQPVQAPVYYPSDGPSDVELLQTTSQTLQAKLDQLTALGLSNDRAGFCRQFVPLDLGAADVQGYLEDLTTHPEADGQWNNLVAESAAIRSGKGVDRIEGDQLHNAVFYFTHPLLLNCDREVAFVYCNNNHSNNNGGGGEWRAEG
jgi:hypothetical protein